MTFGLIPTSPWHLLALLVPTAIWRTLSSTAKKRHITKFHNASFAVSYWEELLFRGIVWGLVITIWQNQLAALIISSLLFGLFHLRNLWWTSQRQVIFNCFYTGLIFGPIVGLVRWWSGDIYLGIAVHALHNAYSVYLAGSETPTDEHLRSKQHNMNWFQRFFSGWWIKR